MENLNQVSQSFKALSHKRRVLLFNLFLNSGPKKLSFGQLQKMSKIPVAPLTITCCSLKKVGWFIGKAKVRTPILRFRWKALNYYWKQ